MLFDLKSSKQDFVYARTDDDDNDDDDAVQRGASLHLIDK